MRGYEAVKYNIKESESGRKSFAFKEDLDELFESDPT